MNWKFIKLSFRAILLGLVAFGCSRSEYTKAVLTELDKGTRQDSILFGINLGDKRDDFYGKCFDLNKNQLVSQGPSNSSVQYIFVDSIVHKEPTEVRLLFYPTFDKDDKISSMNMELSYSAWAPGNSKYSSDTLKVRTIELLSFWYQGNDFITARIGEEEIPVKLDSNRRILVSLKDSQTVAVQVQDILHPKHKHSIEL